MPCTCAASRWAPAPAAVSNIPPARLTSRAAVDRAFAHAIVFTAVFQDVGGDRRPHRAADSSRSPFESRLRISQLDRTATPRTRLPDSPR
jgi:hypothetical protein